MEHLIVNLMVAVFWKVAPCTYVSETPTTSIFRAVGQLITKMEAVYSSEMVVPALIRNPTPTILKAKVNR
jgi:hypothetical protein